MNFDTDSKSEKNGGGLGAGFLTKLKKIRGCMGMGGEGGANICFTKNPNLKKKVWEGRGVGDWREGRK